jgi:hypothetical protein
MVVKRIKRRRKSRLLLNISSLIKRILIASIILTVGTITTKRTTSKSVGSIRSNLKIASDHPS